MNYVLTVFDGLTDTEFVFISSLVRPRGITRSRYREQLADGWFSEQVFLDNVYVMRHVELLMDPWGEQ